ncbi:ATP-binding protein [Lysobacter korlensis]|uniref:ATP-binding protein n=1 Tax=Lysobacter korlensis TaxID=553636 RepID=A0ABV6RSK3_9GAMM
MSAAVDQRATVPRPIFPFAALVGQDALREALLLAAVDPALGGVLITGPRGTAKSTSARALVELLPEGRMVTLPLGATEERLIGTLDVQAALSEGRVVFAPGLLAQAHRGVLYVDEVNLLPDVLVDALLDVAASGVNTVEREGISHSHEASFVLIGTMNPEEGELRPQLIDRFGLMVELENCFDPAVRQQIVQARLAFEADPAAYRARFANAQVELAQRVKHARLALPSLAFSDEVHARVSAICIEAGVDGLRADLVMLRAARALAALEGAQAIALAHVDRVAEAALRHRRKDRGPQPPTREPAPSQAQDDRHDRGGTGAAEPAPATREGDWGYLPPEPVGMAEAKKLRPVLPKP